jgi:hypothetical protein
MQITVPGEIPGFGVSIPWRFYGKGDKKSAVTDLNHIGDFVARIIDDDRTLNKWVYIWEDELTLAEAWATAEHVIGPEWLQEKTDVSVLFSVYMGIFLTSAGCVGLSGGFAAGSRGAGSQQSNFGRVLLQYLLQG